MAAGRHHDYVVIVAAEYDDGFARYTLRTPLLVSGNSALVRSVPVALIGERS